MAINSHREGQIHKFVGYFALVFQESRVNKSFTIQKHKTEKSVKGARSM